MISATDTSRHRTNGAADVLFFQPPSYAGSDVMRDYAGGFGIALPSERDSVGHGQITQPYLSLVYAFGAAIDSGLQAVFLDAQAEHLDLPGIRSRVSDVSPQVIVAVVNLPTLRADLRLLEDIKQLTGASIVAVGTVCRVLTNEVLEVGIVDIAVTGDLEEVGGEILTALSAGEGVDSVSGTARLSQGNIVQNPGGELRSLASVKLPPLERLPMAGYRTWEFGLEHALLGHQYGGWPKYFPLYGSRGCPFACTYCPYPLGFGRQQRVKPVELTLEEFASVARAGTEHVLLRDQVLPIDGGELESLCRGLRRADLGITWVCEARIGSLDRSMLRLMRQAGCVRIHYGIETGDASTFVREAKRGIAPPSVRSTLDETRLCGILPSAHFLVGFKEDTWDSVLKTIHLIREAGIGAGDCSILTPYPGTRVFDEAVAEGRLLRSDWEGFTGTTPVMQLDMMSPVELVMARQFVLEAIDANGGRGLKRRMREATQALSGSRRPSDLSSFVEDLAPVLSSLRPQSRVSSSATGGRA